MFYFKPCVNVIGSPLCYLKRFNNTKNSNPNHNAQNYTRSGLHASFKIDTNSMHNWDGDVGSLTTPGGI